MTDAAWEEDTQAVPAASFDDEAMPGSFDESSLEIDLELVLEDGKEIARRNRAATDPAAGGDVVVFEPTAIGLAAALTRIGYHVRAAKTGVDAMGLVAERTPALLVCGPAQDAERRRLLAAALKLRFPNVPIAYVSSHAGTEDGVAGAQREGAQVVLPWPLPSPFHVARVLAPYVPAPGALPEPAAPRAISMEGPAAADAGFDEARTAVRPQKAQLPRADVVPKKPGAAPPTEPIPPTVAETSPSAATEVRRRGEIGELLNAVSPFLWGLQDAAGYVDELAAQDPRALAHAKTLRLLAKLLGQLQRRIDEIEAR